MLQLLQLLRCLETKSLPLQVSGVSSNNSLLTLTGTSVNCITGISCYEYSEILLTCGLYVQHMSVNVCLCLQVNKAAMSAVISTDTAPS